MSETLKKIEALEAKIKKLKDEVNKPQFEVGEWYKTPRGTVINCQKIFSDDKIYGYGVSWEGRWFYNEDWNDKRFMPATDKEVEDALIAEAKRRGFKEGVIYDAINLGFKGQADCLITSNYFEYRDNILLIDNWRIFENGKWAEIVKDEPIRIGGYEVVFHKLGDRAMCGNCFSANGTTIDGNLFTKEFWQSAKVISEHSKAKIMVGCSKQFDVSLETINQILDKL